MDSQKPPDAKIQVIRNTPAGDTSSTRLRAGDLCPKCNQIKLDYDGLLNLSCAKCGPVAGGCFT